MISHDDRLIFVHIQKTGGTAICAALHKELNPPEKHLLATELRSLYGEDAWRSYFKFAIVRNPWDRLVSWWSMIDARRGALEEGKPLNTFFHYILQNAKTFPEFIDCGAEIFDTDGRKWLHRNQIDYLSDHRGNILVDFIGRFELLQESFNKVTHHVMGRSIELPHVNASDHPHYTTFYSPQLAQRVAMLFEKDIKAFGYSFGM